MWIPVPGTTTPEPAPVEDDKDAAFPFASIAEMCVVPAGDDSSLGAASPRSTRLAAAASR